MIRAFAAVLVAAAVAALGYARTLEPLSFAVTGIPAPAVSRGIEFGIAELTQTARLLGHDVRLVTFTASSSDLAGIVEAGSGRSVSVSDVPAVHLDVLPATATRCDFSVAPPANDTRRLDAWHPSLDRFGASELNERFRRKFDSPFTAEAWLGWIAVKALGEAALRRRDEEDRCEALARLRFDGHKGRPLSFDTVTRILSQPLYVVENGRVVEEVK